MQETFNFVVAWIASMVFMGILALSMNKWDGRAAWVDLRTAFFAAVILTGGFPIVFWVFAKFFIR